MEKKSSAIISFQVLNLSEEVDRQVAAVPALATERGTQAFQIPYRHSPRPPLQEHLHSTTPARCICIRVQVTVVRFSAEHPRLVATVHFNPIRREQKGMK